MATAALLVYANAFGNAFVWDDLHLIVDNPAIKSLRGLGTLWGADLYPQLGSHYYRPLQAITYLADYQLWTLAPFGYHLTNALLHAAVAVLLYVFGVQLLAAPRAALVAALLFAVHPLHTEAVTYIAGRSDSLSALGLLGALVCFLRAERTRFTWWRVASLAAFLGALLARETAIVLMPLVVLVDVAVSRRDGESLHGWWRERIVWRYLPYVAVFGLYLVARFAAVGTGGVASGLRHVPLALRLATMTEVVVRYGALLLVPIHLHMERVVTPATSWLQPTILGSAALIAAAGALAVACWRRAWPVSFGLAWFFIALGPASNIVPLTTFMAEHWLYVPSMGLFLIAGWAADHLMIRGRWRVPVAVVVGITPVVYAGLTMRRNLDWKDGVTLYESTLGRSPSSVRAWISLGEAYQRLGQLDRAEVAYRQALALEPGTWVPYNNLGSMYQDQGRPDLAEQQYRRALALDPRMAAAYNNLGNLYRAQRRPQDAVDKFRDALALNPTDAAAHNNLGLALLDLGQADEAKAEFEAAVRINPEYAAAHSNLGNHYFRRGQLAVAAAEYRAAIRLNPGFAQAHNNLGSVYFNMGQLDCAEQEYRRALELNPGLDEIRRNLDVVANAKARAAGAPAISR